LEQGLDFVLQGGKVGRDDRKPGDRHTIPFGARQTKVSKTGLDSTALPITTGPAPNGSRSANSEQTRSWHQRNRYQPTARPIALVKDLLEPGLVGALV